MQTMDICLFIFVCLFVNKQVDANNGHFSWWLFEILFFIAFCEHTEDTNNINNVTEATGRDQKFENVQRVYSEPVMKWLYKWL